MTRRVIVLASYKGGPGKTTLCAALAMLWHAAGRKVAVVDADPRGGLAYWHGQGAPADLAFVADAGEAVAETIGRQAADLVLVDTGGARTRTVVRAMAAADLVLVPCRASGLDAAVALETLATVQEINDTAERHGNPVLVRVVLTQVVPGSVIARHIRGELEAAGAPLLAGEVGHRVAYAEAMLSGAAPDTEQAIRELAAVAREIEKITGLRK